MGGIRKRGKKNRIQAIFNYLSIKRFENTPYYCDTGKSDCKCRNCKAARAFVSEIERKINEGSFRYQDYFPKSLTIKKLGIANVSSEVTFGTYAWQWYDLKEPNIAYSTSKAYRTAVKALCETFGNMPLNQIKPSHIQTYISKSELSPKTISNYVGVLYSVLQAGVADDILEKNSAEYVDKPEIGSEKIDPFEKGEVEQILKWTKKNYPHITVLYAIGFYTGMRIGEVLALKWSDIDFNKHTILVQRTMTANKLKDSTKTSAYRIIDIIPELDEYLEAHKKYTYMKSDWVILTQYGEPFTKTDNIIDNYYKPCLKALKMRFRILNQMRHSFACMMIDAGENLNWIKNMLGHSTLEMLFKKYGNRINRQDGTRKGVLFSKKSKTGDK
jgi:integrase